MTPVQASPAEAARGRAPLRGVSVLMPTHRGGREMVPAVLSAAGQTHAPLHILVGDQTRHGLWAGDRVLAGVLTAVDAEVLRVPAPGLSFNRVHLALTADTEWLLFLDDDTTLAPNGLALMLAAAERTGAAIVGAAIENVVRYAPRPGPGASWRRTGAGGRTVGTAWTDAGCVLVRRAAFLEAAQHEPTDGRGGEDIVFSAQVAMRHGGVICGAARALHLREEASSWMEHPVDAPWTLREVAPRLDEAGWARFRELLPGVRAAEEQAGPRGEE